MKGSGGGKGVGGGRQRTVLERRKREYLLIKRFTIGLRMLLCRHRVGYNY